MELHVSDADRLLESFEPATPIEHMRYEFALELVDDIRRLDQQIKESHRRIRTAVRASKTSLSEVFGVGPIVACAMIGYSGNVRGSPIGTTSPPMPESLRSSTLQAGESLIVCTARASKAQQRRPQLRRSPRSASPTPTAGHISTARSQRARPSVRLSAP